MSEGNIVKLLLGLIAVLAVLILLNFSMTSPDGLLYPDTNDSFSEIIEEEVPPTLLEELEPRIAELTKGIPAQATYILTDTQTGESLQIGRERTFVAASLYKLFVAYYAYDQIDAGKLSFDTVLENDRTVGSCLDLMITISDNECGVLLGDMFGWSNIDKMIQQNGFTNTVLSPNSTPNGDTMTTPKDVEQFFLRLESGELMKPTYTEHLTNLLLNQEVNNRMPPIIPNDNQIAHKTGDLYDYAHDAGIIYTPEGNYVFVIMTSDWADAMTFGANYEYFKQIIGVSLSGI